MVVVQINLSCLWGSTGKICDSVSKLLSKKNIDNYVFYMYGGNPEQCHNYIQYTTYPYIKIQALKSRLMGNYGFNSLLSTKKLIKKLDEIKPDIVHVHNIHTHDCNFEMLFEYLKEKNIKVFYTFHDCWTFTGYCPHFVMAKCENWQAGCGNCSSYKQYSWFFDKSAENCARKRDALQRLDLTVITPSEWLAGLVKKSFLKDYPIKVINNGIDLSIFKPTESTFRQEHNLSDKKIVLGVSTTWGNPKGLDMFLKLSEDLSEEYKIVLVGVDSETAARLPENIISIHHTQNQQELAAMYSAADVFVNPTREDTFPTVNIESLACGTPVVTFRTGGSPEILDDTCGSVVDCDDYEGLKREIIRICRDNPYSADACVKRAKNYDKNEKYKEYLELYEGIKVARSKRY